MCTQVFLFVSLGFVRVCVSACERVRYLLFRMHDCKQYNMCTSPICYAFQLSAACPQYPSPHNFPHHRWRLHSTLLRVRLFGWKSATGPQLNPYYHDRSNITYQPNQPISGAYYSINIMYTWDNIFYILADAQQQKQHAEFIAFPLEFICTRIFSSFQLPLCQHHHLRRSTFLFFFYFKGWK